MKKKDALTLHYRLGNERDFLNGILEKNEKVTIRRTNYSLKVETDRRNYLFSSGAGVSRKAFAGYNKILSDIKKSGLVTPDVSASDVKYWWFGDGIEYPENFYSVDINAAYPTALYRVGAITKKTYRYLIENIPKSDRLRCVGMLATQKGVYHYENGDLVDFEVDKSDYSGWFFMCCVIVGDIMDECRLRYSDKVLHYWVDGIAIQGDPMDCLCFIEHLGYQSKIEVITECRKFNNWLIYRKDGKKKYLHLPQRVDVTDAEIRTFLGYSDLE